MANLRVIVDPDRACLLDLAHILGISLSQLAPRTGWGVTKPEADENGNLAVTEWSELRAQILKRVRALQEHYRDA